MNFFYNCSQVKSFYISVKKKNRKQKPNFSQTSNANIIKILISLKKYGNQDEYVYLQFFRYAIFIIEFYLLLNVSAVIYFIKNGIIFFN